MSFLNKGNVNMECFVKRLSQTFAEGAKLRGVY